MRKVFLLAGHGGGDPGACALGYEEAKLAIEQRDLIKLYLERKGVVVFIDNDTWNLSTTIKWVESQCTPNDLLIDLHFNASLNKEVGGSEVIIPERHTTTERLFASEMLAETVHILKIKNRGVKTESQTARKKLGIFRPVCNQILMETGFISHGPDMLAYQPNKVTLAEAHSGVIYRYATS